MISPNFDGKGLDSKSYSPFTLHNCLATEFQDVRLSFNDWYWFQDKYGTDTIDGYYVNGYGLEGLVKAALFAAKINLDDDGIHCNSEGDTCYIHFKDLDAAVRAAELASAMIGTPETLAKMIKVAREQGFEE